MKENKKKAQSASDIGYALPIPYSGGLRIFKQKQKKAIRISGMPTVLGIPRFAFVERHTRYDPFSGVDIPTDHYLVGLYLPHTRKTIAGMFAKITEDTAVNDKWLDREDEWGAVDYMKANHGQIRRELDAAFGVVRLLGMEQERRHREFRTCPMCGMSI